MTLGLRNITVNERPRLLSTTAYSQVSPTVQKRSRESETAGCSVTWKENGRRQDMLMAGRMSRNLQMWVLEVGVRLGGMGVRLRVFQARGANWQRSEERRVGKECRSRWSPYH